MSQNQENIVTGTREMMEAALADARELIRSGKWPEPQEGDDHLDYDEDVLPPARPMTLKAAE